MSNIMRVRTSVLPIGKRELPQYPDMKLCVGMTHVTPPLTRLVVFLGSQSVVQYDPSPQQLSVSCRTDSTKVGSWGRQVVHECVCVCVCACVCVCVCVCARAAFV